MSKKCPYCGSYNTEVAVGNWVKRGLINAGRGVLVVGAYALGSIGGPTMGKAAGYSILQNTKQPDLLGSHCCNCGHDF